VYFASIEPSDHYLEHHAHDCLWEEVVGIIFITKNPRKKGNKYEIETSTHYVLFEIQEQKLIVINAKRK
jgi:hypothetical protein